MIIGCFVNFVDVVKEWRICIKKWHREFVSAVKNQAPALSPRSEEILYSKATQSRDASSNCA